jgi:hypothetical protein
MTAFRNELLKIARNNPTLRSQVLPIVFEYDRKIANLVENSVYESIPLNTKKAFEGSFMSWGKKIQALLRQAPSSQVSRIMSITKRARTPEDLKTVSKDLEKLASNIAKEEDISTPVFLGLKKAISGMSIEKIKDMFSAGLNRLVDVMEFIIDKFVGMKDTFLYLGDSLFGNRSAKSGGFFAVPLLLVGFILCLSQALKFSTFVNPGLALALGIVAVLVAPSLAATMYQRLFVGRGK